MLTAMALGVLEKLFMALDAVGVVRNEKISAAQVTERDVRSALGAPVFSLGDEDLLKIFSFLSLGDLLQASRVCRWWYRLSFDGVLWKNVDMRRFATRLTDPDTMQSLLVKRFSTKIRSLDLSGFTLSDETLQRLASCKGLRVLKLKSVKFTATTRPLQQNELQEKRVFPKKLEELDIRFSHGHSQVYRAIALGLSNIKSLGLCDAFLYTLFKDNNLETTIERMTDLRFLDLSHCLLLKDSTVAMFACCRKLEVLSVRKCHTLGGSFVQDILQSCVHLTTLVLDGIGIDDNTLQSIKWQSSRLIHLELGSCPLITPSGLNLALPQVTNIKSLEYLGLRAIGKCKELDDDVVVELAASISRTPNKNLKWFSLGYSRYITVDGLNMLCSFVKSKNKTNCSALSLKTDTKCHKNVHVPLPNTGMKIERQVFSGSYNFFSLNCSLETPV